MAYPKELRNQLGLSLDELSTLINCGRSQLSMVELGKRALPTKSLAPLWALENAMNQNDQHSIGMMPNAPQTIQWLKKELRTSKVHQQQLLLKQEMLQEQLQKVQIWLGTATMLNGSLPFNKDDTASLQFKLLKREAMHKQEQLQLDLCKCQIQLAVMAVSIKEAETLMGNG